MEAGDAAPERDELQELIDEAQNSENNETSAMTTSEMPIEQEHIPSTDAPEQQTVVSGSQEREPTPGQKRKRLSDDEDGFNSSNKRKRIFYEQFVDREAQVEDPDAQSSDEEELADEDEGMDGFIENSVADDFDGRREVEQRKKKKSWRKTKRRLQLTREERELISDNQGIKSQLGLDIDHDIGLEEEKAMLGPKSKKLKLREDDTELDLAPLEEPGEEAAYESEIFADDQSLAATHKSFVEYEPGETITQNMSIVNELFGDVEDLITIPRLTAVLPAPKDSEILDIIDDSVKKRVDVGSLGLRALYEDFDEDEEEEKTVKTTQAVKKVVKKQLSAFDIRKHKVLNTDLPERMYDRLMNTEKNQLDDAQLRDEARWIQKHGFHQNEVRGNRFNIPDIVRVLKWIRVDKLDIPAIRTQHRDEIPTGYTPRASEDDDDEKHEKELSRLEKDLQHHLWIIDEYDEKYQKFYLRQEKLATLYVTLMERGSPELTVEVKQYIDNALTQEELDDAQNLLSAYGAEEEREAIKLPDLPIVTMNEVVPYDTVRINDGYVRIQEHLTEINQKIEDCHKVFGIQQKQKAIEEIKALLAFYEKQVQQGYVGGMKDDDEDAPPCETEEAQKFEGCSLEDEADVQQFFNLMKTKTQELVHEIDEMVASKECVADEFRQLKQYYEKLVEIAKTKTYSGLKKPKRSARNHLAEFLLLKPLIDKIGSIPELGQSLQRTSRTRRRKQQDGESFETLLEEFSKLNPKYPTAKHVKKALIHVMARRLGLEPRVRKRVREILYDTGSVSSEPTYEGKLRIDWMHQFATIKRLNKKPVREFLRSGCEHWVLMEEAHKAGLVKYVFEVRKSDHERWVPPEDSVASSLVTRFMHDMIEHWCTEVGTSQQDEIRGSVAREALTLYLQPMAMKYIKKRLLEHSHVQIAETCCKKLRDLCNLGFVKFPEQKQSQLMDPDVEDLESGRARNILSCVVGDFQEPSFVVCLNEKGDVLENLQLHFMKESIRYTPGQRTEHQKALTQRKHKDTFQFKNFVRQHMPSFIAIDASGIQCRRFQLEVLQALTGLGKEATTPVVLVDPSVSRIYKRSEKAERELSSYPSGARQAVSLGRFCLDPISEVCNLWYSDKVTGSNNILALPLSPISKYVPENVMIQSLRRVLIQEVNMHGVILNNMVSREWHRGPLQFVCGLGQIRAEALLKSLSTQGHMYGRPELVNRGIMQHKVYENACSFLRIETEIEMNPQKEVEINLLDGTLIHPVDYSYAELVISNALDLEPEDLCKDKNQQDMSEEARLYKTREVNDCIVKIRDSPEMIDALNLEAFAKSIYDDKKQRIKFKLLCIKRNVKKHYTLSRESFTDFEKGDDDTEKAEGAAKLFDLLTGESERTLAVGQILTCRVLKTNWAGVKCTLENGLDCWIPADHLNQEVQDKLQKSENKFTQDDPKRKQFRQEVIEEYIQVGQHVTARVVKIAKEKLSVMLSMRKEHMENTVKTFRQDHDDRTYEKPRGKCEWLVLFHPDDDVKTAIDEDNKRKHGPMQPFISRQIDFQHFKNVSKEDAEQLLIKEEIGSIIIRPSKKGLDYLSLSWKMASEPDIIVHFLITEKEKPNQYALGRKLVIGRDNAFDELDELVHVFIDKMNDMRQQVVKFDNFKYGNEEDIKELLLDDKQENPLTIPYYLSYSYKEPGRFLLSYIPGTTTVQQEYISLTFKGFRFRGGYHRDPTNLIRWFKKNPIRTNRPGARKRKKKGTKRKRDNSNSLSDSSPRHQGPYYGSDNSTSQNYYDSASHSDSYSSQTGSGRSMYDMAPRPGYNQSVVPDRYQQQFN